MSEYAGKKTVITGGTAGIGLATAKALLAGGAEVLLTGLTERNLEAAQRELGPRAYVVRSDTASPADRERLAALVDEKLGRVDLVFINAGFAALASFEAATEELYERTFAINTKGAYFTALRLAPCVRDGGAFVFTTSIADQSGAANMSLYAGAKAAVRAFVRGLATELLPRGIRVNAVSPGFTRTPTLGVFGASLAEVAAFEKEGEERTPMGRIGSPDEVARAVLFLAFDATFTTGAELPVDGGLSQL